MTPARHILVLLICGIAIAARGQSARPADATLDWLMEQAADVPAPATAPTAATTRPASPFAPADDAAWRSATVVLSDGQTIAGDFSTTRDKPVRIWSEQEKRYRDIPFGLIRSFEARVLWERDQPEWRFVESGSDIRELTGRAYPAREMVYVVTLVNGQSVTGGVVMPLYQDTPEGNRLLALHKRHKGEVGQTLRELVYVQRVDFHTPATRPATQPHPPHPRPE